VILSIVIPAYNRPNELKTCLESFINQVNDNIEDDIEIIVCDDNSDTNSLAFVKEFENTYKYICYKKYKKNIGLEQNLINSTKFASGKYLWIFGDDDFLESKHALNKILKILKTKTYEILILNRTRRSFDLEKLITNNWMNLDSNKNYEFARLNDFCLKYGFISVIGFISVNIFLREKFLKVDKTPYMGTMYPQLGSMVEAFGNNKTLLIGEPLICHRTQTQEEKRKALGNKKSESSFMSGERKRNALYFSHPFCKMLNTLIDRKVLTTEEVVNLPESVFSQKSLIDFLIFNLTDSINLSIKEDISSWRDTKLFFDKLTMKEEQSNLIKPLIESQI